MPETQLICPSCKSGTSTGSWHIGTSMGCPNCGASMVQASTQVTPEAALPAADAPPPEVQAAMKIKESALGRFILVSEIGNGAMGKVWKAWDTLLRRWVAIKIMTLRGVSAEDLARFKREAKMSAQLEHPNIGPVYDLGESDGRNYIVMKLIDGRTLDRALYGGPVPVDPREVVTAMRDASRGVAYAHERNCIHRDIKPSNIMIDKDKHVFVMDFGLAKSLMSAGITIAGARLILGTPGYMSPEAATGNVDSVDIRSDVFSLGASLLALLIGRLPYAGQTPMDLLKNTLRDTPPRVRSVRPELPPMLDEIVAKSLAKKKEDRYPHAGAFADALEGLLGVWTSPHTSAAPRVRRALVACDDVATAALLQICLGELSLTAQVVRDGPSLENAARIAGAALAVVDARLSGGEGHRYAGRLRAIAGWDKIPIAIVGDESADGAVGLAFDAGADEFMGKGSGRSAIVARLRKLLR